MNRSQAAGALALVVSITAGAYAYQDRPQKDAYTDVEELVADLERNGVECQDLTVSPPEQSQQVGAEFGFCLIGTKNVNIHVYEQADRVEGHVEGNVSVRGDHPNYFTSLVRGSNWVVDTYSEETSERVQEAIGGTIE